MTELVEKIAEAIGIAGEPCDCTSPPCPHCMDEARAALKAAIEGLMEPSPTMLRIAGVDRIGWSWARLIRAAAEENGIKLEPTE